MRSHNEVIFMLVIGSLGGGVLILIGQCLVFAAGYLHHREVSKPSTSSTEVDPWVLLFFPGLLITFLGLALLTLSRAEM